MTIARIPGMAGTQLVIEEELKVNGRKLEVAIEAIKRLPKCPEREGYLRLVLEHQIKYNKLEEACQTAILFTDQSETLQVLDAVIMLAYKVRRHESVKQALTLYPPGEVHSHQVNALIDYYLANHGLQHALELCKLYDRKFTPDELEKYVASSLTESYHTATLALRMLGRELSLEELRQVITTDSIKTDVREYQQKVLLLPAGEERTMHLEALLERFLNEGERYKCQEVVSELGRCLTTTEYRLLLSKNVPGSKQFLSESDIRQLAESMVYEEGNIPYLKTVVREQIALGESKVAYLIAKELPRSCFREGKDEAEILALFEAIGQAILLQQNGYEKTDLAKKCVSELRDSSIRHQLAQHLVAEYSYKRTYPKTEDSALRIDEAIKAANFLSKGEFKVEILEGLYKRCLEFESSRVSLEGVPGQKRHIERLLNECGA